jgi:hypothetical protein
MATHEFYMQRAEECGRDADQAVLANVRERHLVSREAWLAMAERIEQTNQARQASADAKALLVLETEDADASL